MENEQPETAVIVHSLLLKSAPAEVFETLMDEKKHSKLTGKPAKIAPKEEGEFALLGGFAHGINIEVRRGKKIVQAWNCSEAGWPADHFAICTFVLAPAETGTKLSFTQTGIPPELLETMTDFWTKNYWEKLTAIFK